MKQRWSGRHNPERRPTVQWPGYYPASMAKPSFTCRFGKCQNPEPRAEGRSQRRGSNTWRWKPTTTVGAAMKARLNRHNWRTRRVAAGARWPGHPVTFPFLLWFTDLSTFHPGAVGHLSRAMQRSESRSVERWGPVGHLRSRSAARQH